MTSPATVSIARPAREDFARSQRVVWASLPVSLSEGPGEARLLAVDGRLPDWLDTLAAAIPSGLAGALVVRPVAGPSAHDIRAVADAATDAGTTVVVQTAWASNPAVPQLAGAAAEKVPAIRLVDSLVQVPGDSAGQWADVLLDHLALLRAMSWPLDAVDFAAHGANGYTVNGRQQATAVTMSAVRSAPGQPGRSHGRLRRHRRGAPGRSGGRHCRTGRGLDRGPGRRDSAANAVRECRSRVLAATLRRRGRAFL